MSDPTLEARRKASIEDLERLRLFREVEFIPIDANALQKLYQQAKNAISRDFIFAERTVIPEIKVSTKPISDSCQPRTFSISSRMRTGN